MALDLEEVNLNEICRLVVDEIQAAHPDRRVQFEEQGEVRGRWDAGRIAQVLSNLIGNAAKHGTPDAPIRVSVEQEGDEARVALHSAGPPIPEALLPHVFRPFRSHGARPDSHGLGLYISQEIVRAHGGRIAVTSTEDRGTCFTLHLPLRRELKDDVESG